MRNAKRPDLTPSKTQLLTILKESSAHSWTTRFGLSEGKRRDKKDIEWKLYVCVNLYSQTIYVDFEGKRRDKKMFNGNYIFLYIHL